jgi:hypothetical protein
MAVSVIHTIYSSLQHALSLLSLLSFEQLSDNGYQLRCFLSFHAQRLLPLLSGGHFTRLGVTTQWLTTMGALRLPHLCRGWLSQPQAVSQLLTTDSRLSLDSRPCRLTGLWFDSPDITSGHTQQKTLLFTIPLLLHDVIIDTDTKRTPFPVVLPLVTWRDVVCCIPLLHRCLLCHNLVMDVSSD